MKQAMSILRQFSEKERDYHAYQVRQNYLREQHSIQREQKANQREREARAEIDRLKALLEQQSGKR